MSTYGTTSYTRDAEGRLVETHRDLTEAELPLAVFAVEASDDRERSYASNGLRWADEADARRWADGLVMRWFGCTNVRVVRLAEVDGHQRCDGSCEVVHQSL